MSSVCRIVVIAVAAIVAAAGAKVDATTRPPLRVCADPNNLPFSNDRREGFENKIAELVARELGRPLAYFWAPQRRGFIRNTVGAQRCDLVIGVPSGYRLLQTSRPYYRSAYALVSRHD